MTQIVHGIPRKTSFCDFLKYSSLYFVLMQNLKTQVKVNSCIKSQKA